MPRFKPAAAFEVTEDGKVSRYEIEGRRPKDKEDISLSVSPDGKTIEINDGTEVDQKGAGDKAKAEEKGDKPKTAGAKGKKAKP
jgi:hypothetical protein